ncbi:MAG: hypothetical protein RLZZ618_3313 [Pseudomonadota bacterium]|jgi:hypothetical protein
MTSRPSLLLLDGEPLGSLAILGSDMYWIHGRFTPLPAFERVAPLFRLLESALDDNVDAQGETADLHLNLLQHANQLGLTVKHPNEKVEAIEDFKIEAGRFEYKTAVQPAEGTTVLLGSECDAALLSRLRQAVLRQGGSIAEASFTVAGSQEVIVFDIRLPAGVLEVVSETYVGLSLCGPADLVAALVSELDGR